MVDIVTLLYGIVAGVLGGVTYGLVLQLWNQRSYFLQHVALGAIVGLILWLITASTAPDTLTNPVTYVVFWAGGYFAIDVIKGLLAKYKPQTLPGGNGATGSLQLIDTAGVKAVSFNPRDPAIWPHLAPATRARLEAIDQGVKPSPTAGPSGRQQGAHNIQISPSNVECNESVVVVDPFNGNHLIAGCANPAVSQTPGNLSFVSFDGGKTWMKSIAFASALEGASICILPDGLHCYYATLSYNPNQPIAQVTDSADGGKTWGFSGIVQLTPGDKTSIVAAGGKVFLVYTNFQQVVLARPVPNQQAWKLGALAAAGQGQTPAIGPDGIYHVAYADANVNGILYSKGADVDRFSSPVLIAPNVAQFYNMPGGFNDGSVEALSITGTCMVVDAFNTVYLGLNVNGRPIIVISPDGGGTWGQPFDVDPSDGRKQFMPALATSGGGECSFYNLVWDAASSTYVIKRHQTLDGGKTWAHQVITDQGFIPAPPPQGFRIGFGDYFGASANSSVEAAAWSESTASIWNLWGNVLGVAPPPPPPPTRKGAPSATSVQTMVSPSSPTQEPTVLSGSVDNPNPVSGQHVTMTVKLTFKSDGAALAGRTVNFTYGTGATSAVTDQNGQAAGTLVAPTVPSPTQVPFNASFPGDTAI